MNNGARIKYFRAKSDLNQKQLADMIGVNQANISFWEKSTYPPLDAIEKICKALNIEVWKFLLNQIKN